MEKLISRLSVSLLAVAVFISAAPAAVFAASYTIDAPSSVSITASDLIATNGSGVAIDSDAVAAIATSENTVEMTLIGMGAPEEPGLEHVRIEATEVSGGPGTVQLWIHESSSNTWYDSAITGWGPGGGFPITADYNDSVSVVVVADQAGTYTLNYRVVDLDNSSATVAEGTSSLTVEEQTSAVVTSEAEFNDAVANEAITTITIADDFEVSSTLTIDRAVAVDGDGHTIAVAGTVTGTGLLITGDNVSVTDLTVDAASNLVQAIQAYRAENIILSGVTAKNAGKSGIMVNGSTVTVEDVTTSGNGWHGINVDQGSGVTEAAILTVSGTSSHLESGPAIYIDDTAKGSVQGSLEQYTTVAAAPAIAFFLSTVDSEEELSQALANSAIETIALGGDITTSAAVVVNRSVAIDGNGKTLAADFVKTTSSNNSVILVTASDVSISDLIVDGGSSSNNLHGINIYVATGIVLTDVETKRVNTGVNVNGSTVSITNLTTSQSAWHSVNVDQGSGVTTAAALTISGDSSHDEESDIPHIWVDDITLPLVSVTDVDGQYDATEVVWDDAGTQRTGRSYTFKSEQQSSGGGGGSSRRNSDRDDDDAEEVEESEEASQGEVLGAASYNFTTDLTIGSTGQDVTELQTILIAAGYLKIGAPTGYFGSLTEAAVKLYQAANGIPATGYVGPLTLAALNASGAPASAEQDAARLAALVVQLQAMLEMLNSVQGK